MVLQGVYVHDVVAAGQLVSFGISTFAALIGVDGIAGVEESVAYAVKGPKIRTFSPLFLAVIYT